MMMLMVGTMMNWTEDLLKNVVVSLRGLLNVIDGFVNAW